LLINLECSDEVCLDRYKSYIENSKEKAEDLTEELFKYKLEYYRANTSRVIEYYSKKGNYRLIDVDCALVDSYMKVKKALRPEITFIIGQPASGKTIVANNLINTQNASYIDASDIKLGNDEESVKILSSRLDALRVGQKVIVEDFPRNANEALLFSKNYQPPIKCL